MMPVTPLSARDARLLSFYVKKYKQGELLFSDNLQSNRVVRFLFKFDFSCATFIDSLWKFVDYHESQVTLEVFSSL